MFSDTHFHLRHIVKDKGLDGTLILKQLTERGTFFALDVGTQADDLSERISVFNDCAEKLPQSERQKAQAMTFFSAGIWPATEEIRQRSERIGILKSQIAQAEAAFQGEKKIIAIGECGFDHHWNPSGPDGRSASDFDSAALKGERELFESQLDLAKQENLPVIVHTRDAFSQTLDCLKNANCRALIHCFSYGIEEARAFLDAGCFIAFGGAITYAKKSKLPAMIQLLRFVPEDRFLMETDAPYLAPVPFRGKINTPVLIEHTYNFAAEAKGISALALSQTVDANIKRFFNI